MIYLHEKQDYFNHIHVIAFFSFTFPAKLPSCFPTTTLPRLNNIQNPTPYPAPQCHVIPRFNNITQRSCLTTFLSLSRLRQCCQLRETSIGSCSEINGLILTFPMTLFFIVCLLSCALSSRHHA